MLHRVALRRVMFVLLSRLIRWIYRGKERIGVGTDCVRAPEQPAFAAVAVSSYRLSEACDLRATGLLLGSQNACSFISHFTLSYTYACCFFLAGDVRCARRPTTGSSSTSTPLRQLTARPRTRVRMPHRRRKKETMAGWTTRPTRTGRTDRTRCGETSKLIYMI